MTPDTYSRQGTRIVIAVAAVAFRGHMCPGQRIVCVMNGKCCRLPAGICGVAILAAGGNIDGGMRRICRLVVIRLMAGYAYTGNIGERPGCMALVTIDIGMAKRQREKRMVRICPAPRDAVHGVAFKAVC